jgi:hypothetical protein
MPWVQSTPGTARVGEVIRVRVRDVLAEEQPDPGPELEAAGGLLDVAVQDAQGPPPPPFDVDLGERRPAAQRARNGIGHQGFREHTALLRGTNVLTLLQRDLPAQPFRRPSMPCHVYR